ncbi:MAG: S-adenosylmethionine decarboxylase [Planctomycetes bacterium]|nr:S-adenosylmethionine decarboxylase [Planctomycetota bacterium]
MYAGEELIVDAEGCCAELLAEMRSVRAVCKKIVEELALQIVGEPQWHQFPFPGGVTGLYLLTESHLTCHTFPELRLATFNLYCCRPRPRWQWSAELAESLGAKQVRVRRVPRGLLLESATGAAVGDDDLWSLPPGSMRNEID